MQASPSHTNPDYYYHWMRDAAISMDVLMHLPNSSEPQSYDAQMKQYINWVHATQTKADQNCDVRGEPKFLLDGTGMPYPGGWMRPQNDGCALRTVAIVNYGTKQFQQVCTEVS